MRPPAPERGAARELTLALVAIPRRLVLMSPGPALSADADVLAIPKTVVLAVMASPAIAAHLRDGVVMPLPPERRKCALRAVCSAKMVNAI